VRRQEAEQSLAALAIARGGWLKRTVADLSAEALWLVGSLGRGDGDQWSDVDLLVIGGELPLHEALLTLEVPHNGPAAGRYVGAMYALGSLPLWVDWYLWPADLAIPRDARLLAGRGQPSQYTLFELLDHHGRGPNTTPTAPSTFTLAMLPLAAKFIARGNISAATSMATMLGARTEPSVLHGLRNLLASTPGSAVVRDRVGAVLDLAAALTTSDTTTDDDSGDSRVAVVQPP
jgi:hypothetical protein